MLGNMQPRLTIERSGGDRDRVAVEFTPEKIAAALVAEAALGLIRRFEPGQTTIRNKGYALGRCIGGREEITGRLAALSAMAGDHFAHRPIDCELNRPTQAPARPKSICTGHSPLPFPKTFALIVTEGPLRIISIQTFGGAIRTVEASKDQLG